MPTLHYTSLTLAIIGALNWGLIGLFQFDLVAAIFGGPTAALSRVVYTLVGLAGLVLFFTGYNNRIARRDVTHPLRRAA